MNIFIIILVIAIVSVVIMYFSEKHDEKVKEEKPKFEPRKITYISKKDVIDSVDKPKSKYYKKRNKKKKSDVAESAPTEKKPVGRPKKAE